MDCSTSGSLVIDCLPEFAQIHVHQIMVMLSTILFSGDSLIFEFLLGSQLSPSLLLYFLNTSGQESYFQAVQNNFLKMFKIAPSKGHVSFPQANGH